LRNNNLAGKKTTERIVLWDFSCFSCLSWPLADDVNINDLARGTPGFSGAELANLINEGALFRAQQSARGDHEQP